MILDAIPARAQRALDVGCGEGTLARELRAVVPQVTAIDADPASIDLARQQDSGAHIDYLLGDFLTYPFEPNSFDLVTSVAALHHMDAHTALHRMRDLLRPGGTLAIIGLARPDLPADLPAVIASVVATRLHHLAKKRWSHPSPTVWPPPETYAGIRRLAARDLPEVRYRRHPLWRYSLIWTKPRPSRWTQPNFH
ncbi:MAG: class I SAM-dependent methyltransferase [Actinomycetota bacterium]|nr:class I SAM-dependent methyltransferase [Actinomycetota bacterium]